jgi:hypothetical protein
MRIQIHVMYIYSLLGTSNIYNQQKSAQICFGNITIC